jgi:opioid growth factor receptor-like protein
VLVDSVVDFYSGGRDSEQRTLDEILGWDDGRLEDVHDYIQWLFPSRQPSAVNPFAPLVTDDTVRAFERNPRLRDRLRRAFERMLRFYGLQTADGRVEIDPSAFLARSRVWLTPGNHNHLRLTRIMDSLSTLGLRAEAVALQRCLIEDVASESGQGRISPRTIDFWLGAVSAQKE